jgi:hypothetical protein
VSVRVLWEPRDLWIGIYWTRSAQRLLIYVCVLPCLPILFSFGVSPTSETDTT